MKNDRVVAHPDVLLTPMKDGTGVLLNVKTKFYYTLNETGCFAWKQLEKAKSKGLSIAELAASVNQTYEVEVGTAEADLRALFDELVAEGLLVA